MNRSSLPHVLMKWTPPEKPLKAFMTRKQNRKRSVLSRNSKHALLGFLLSHSFPFFSRGVAEPDESPSIISFLQLSPFALFCFCYCLLGILTDVSSLAHDQPWRWRDLVLLFEFIHVGVVLRVIIGHAGRVLVPEKGQRKSFWSPPAWCRPGYNQPCVSEDLKG